MNTQWHDDYDGDHDPRNLGDITPSIFALVPGVVFSTVKPTPEAESEGVPEKSEV